MSEANTMTKEALSIYDTLKLALECAERCEEIDGMYSWSATITAINEALAQPAVTDFLHKYARLTADAYTDEKDGDVVYSFYGGDLESFCDLIQTHGIKENT